MSLVTQRHNVNLDSVSLLASSSENYETLSTTVLNVVEKGPSVEAPPPFSEFYNFFINVSKAIVAIPSPDASHIPEPRLNSVRAYFGQSSSDILLENIRLVSQDQGIYPALNVLMERIYQYMGNGNLNACEDVLNKVNVSNYPAEVVVGFLRATVPAKSVLKNRAKFVEKVNEYLNVKVGTDRTQKIMRGLR